MDAIDLLILIRKNLDTNDEIHLTSPTMYNGTEYERKVSFAVFEECEKGIFKRFTVTVEDSIKPKF